MFFSVPPVDLDAAAAVPPVGLEGGRAAALPAPPAGLVRLETSTTRDDENALPWPEQQRVACAKRRSLRVFKSISCAGDLLAAPTDERGRRLDGIFLTCTYGPDAEWRPNQISGLMDNIGQWCRRRGIVRRVVWVAEQHKSGRVHYHAILFLPKGLMLPKPDKQGWWPYGMTRIERCRKRTVGYLIKYATKCQAVSKPWPKGCRLSGCGGLDQPGRQRRAWWVLPKYQRERCEPDQRCRRASGGGWVSPVTGEWWPAWDWRDVPWQAMNAN